VKPYAASALKLSRPFAHIAMAPHLEPKEIDQIRKWFGKGMPPVTIHARLAASRLRRDMDAPHLTNVRKVLKGFSYKASGQKETRGRPKIFTLTKVKQLDRVRKRLYKEAEGDYEVLWQDVIDKTPGVDAHASTVGRALKI
jgi:hypothetical protein